MLVRTTPAEANSSPRVASASHTASASKPNGVVGATGNTAPSTTTAPGETSQWTRGTPADHSRQADRDIGPYPLLVTRNDRVLDEALRIAALAGTQMHVAPDPAAARPYWTDAPLVLISSDLAAECARARLPRRRDVALIPVDPVTGDPPQAIWDLATDVAADQVLVLPDGESWLVRRLSESAAGTAKAKVVATVPGSGGAGASVLATGLAVTAVRHGARPLLVDADPLGGGLDVLLGWEERAGLRWPDLTEASGAMSVDGLYSALPHAGNLVVLSWDRSDPAAVPESAIDAVIDAGRRGSDLVVVDLPHQLDESAVRVLQSADLALLVVRPDIRGCAAAGRMSSLIRPHCATLEAVVRGPAPGNLRPSDVSANLRLPLAASLRPESGLPMALDRGEPPAAGGRGPLAALCRRLLIRLEVVAGENRP